LGKAYTYLRMVVPHMLGGGAMRFAAIQNPILATTREGARQNVRALYRRICRNMPLINHIFELPEFDPHRSVQNVKNQSFVPNLGVRELHLIERLRFFGDTEFSDSVNLFKTKAHVYDLITTPEERGQANLLPINRDESRRLFKDKAQSAFMTEFLTKA